MTGNAKVGFLEDDLDGDFDAKRFDKLMNVIKFLIFYQDFFHGVKICMSFLLISY